MKLTVIGSGTATFRKERKATSLLLEVGGKFLLFDCGWGCGVNLLNAGYDIQDLDAILISHPHADHMGNLMNILQSMLVTGIFYPKRKRSKELYLHGYQGFTKDYEDLRRIMFPERVEQHKIYIKEYPNSTETTEGIRIIGREVYHVPQYFHAVAYRVEYKGKSFVYSGDLGYDKAFVELARNADMAVMEMAVSLNRLKTEGKNKGHLSPIECGQIAKEAKVKKLVLVHGYDENTPSEIKSAVRQHFKGPVILAKDLQRINIT